jgi:DNA-binding MarR family transcriptional regulator
VNHDTDRDALAAAVWRRMFGFLMSTRHQRDEVLLRLGLTPNDARAFASLGEGEGRTMHTLAQEWGCDASNATWIVDRLERRGFVERLTVASDRRLKLVRLTPLGVETKAALIGGMTEPPPELRGLSATELQALVDALAKLPIDEAELARFVEPSRVLGRPPRRA